MFEHQVPDGHRYKYQNHAWHVYGDSGWTAIDAELPIVFGSSILLGTESGFISLSMHEALWVSSEMGIEIREMRCGRTYVAAVREKFLVDNDS